MVKKMLVALLIIVILLLIASPVLTLLLRQPTIAVVVQTWSMAPLLARGDLVFLWPAGENTTYAVGQIIVFRSREHGIHQWTMHRIVGGDAASGFITRGDANKYNDQDDGSYPPVQPGWIAGVVPVLGSLPVKIPLVGHLALFFEQHVVYHRFIPVLVAILAAALAFDEFFKNKKRRRKEALSKSQLYLLGGIAVAVLMGSLMLAGSLFITFPYGVEDSPGVLMGSDVGILKQGDFRKIPLADITNEGRLPSFYHAVSSDPQVVLHETGYRLRGGESAGVEATIYAREPGLYQAQIIVGLFMPFLPPAVAGFLVRKNFWLALLTVSFIPALPIIAYPYLDPRCRRRFRVSWRRFLEKAAAVLKY